RNAAPEPLPYAITRYEKEALRLLGVMEGQLAKTPYLAGDYSIADIATFPWVAAAKTSYMGLALEEFPQVQRWIEALKARPAVQVGMDVLKPTFKSQFGTVVAKNS
ncbi:MAG: glutathione S-transferase C-terminal domain-containing protein, partial [Cyanobacteria bacterium J06638_6]